MSIFARIIAWDLPCYKVYENDQVYAFLDINQYYPGSVLVVSKKEVDHFFDLDSSDYHALFEAARLLSPVLKTVFQTRRVWLVIEWFEVSHTHVKLLPINSWFDDHQGKTHTTITPEEMSEIQKRIIDWLLLP